MRVESPVRPSTSFSPAGSSLANADVSAPLGGSLAPVSPAALDLARRAGGAETGTREGVQQYRSTAPSTLQTPEAPKPFWQRALGVVGDWCRFLFIDPAVSLWQSGTQFLSAYIEAQTLAFQALGAFIKGDRQKSEELLGKFQSRALEALESGARAAFAAFQLVGNIMMVVSVASGVGAGMAAAWGGLRSVLAQAGTKAAEHTLAQGVAQAARQVAVKVGEECSEKFLAESVMKPLEENVARQAGKALETALTTGKQVFSEQLAKKCVYEATEKAVAEQVKSIVKGDMTQVLKLISEGGGSKGLQSLMSKYGLSEGNAQALAKALNGAKHDEQLIKIFTDEITKVMQGEFRKKLEQKAVGQFFEAEWRKQVMTLAEKGLIRQDQVAAALTAGRKGFVEGVEAGIERGVREGVEEAFKEHRRKRDDDQSNAGGGGTEARREELPRLRTDPLVVNGPQGLVTIAFDDPRRLEEGMLPQSRRKEEVRRRAALEDGAVRRKKKGDGGKSAYERFVEGSQAQQPSDREAPKPVSTPLDDSQLAEVE